MWSLTLQFRWCTVIAQNKADDLLMSDVIRCSAVSVMQCNCAESGRFLDVCFRKSEQGQCAATVESKHPRNLLEKGVNQREGTLSRLRPCDRPVQEHCKICDEWCSVREQVLRAYLHSIIWVQRSKWEATKWGSVVSYFFCQTRPFNIMPMFTPVCVAYHRVKSHTAHEDSVISFIRSARRVTKFSFRTETSVMTHGSHIMDSPLLKDSARQVDEFVVSYGHGSRLSSDTCTNCHLGLSCGNFRFLAQVELIHFSVGGFRPLGSAHIIARPFCENLSSQSVSAHAIMRIIIQPLQKKHVLVILGECFPFNFTLRIFFWQESRQTAMRLPLPSQSGHAICPNILSKSYHNLYTSFCFDKQSHILHNSCKLWFRSESETHDNLFKCFSYLSSLATARAVVSFDVCLPHAGSPRMYHAKATRPRSVGVRTSRDTWQRNVWNISFTHHILLREMRQH